MLTPTQALLAVLVLLDLFVVPLLAIKAAYRRHAADLAARYLLADNGLPDPGDGWHWETRDDFLWCIRNDVTIATPTGRDTRLVCASSCPMDQIVAEARDCLDQRDQDVRVIGWTADRQAERHRLSEEFTRRTGIQDTTPVVPRRMRG